MSLTYKAFDILRDAFIEIGFWAPGEDVNDSPDEAQWGLRKLNYLIDEWQAQEKYVYSYAFQEYTLVPGLSPHTIGPGGTFDTGTVPRPVRLESAAQLLNVGIAGGPVDLPINLRDNMWWANQQVKNIQTNVVTDVYYDPTYPLGSLYFWPVPNTANDVRLQFWQIVSQFNSVQDPIGGPGGPGTLPEAYRAALMLTLAEYLCPGAKLQVPVQLKEQALKARTAVFANNAHSPRICTNDSGMPRAGVRSGIRGDWSWATGGRAGGPPE